MLVRARNEWKMTEYCLRPNVDATKSKWFCLQFFFRFISLHERRAFWVLCPKSAKTSSHLGPLVHPVWSSRPECIEFIWIARYFSSIVVNVCGSKFGELQALTHSLSIACTSSIWKRFSNRTNWLSSMEILHEYIWSVFERANVIIVHIISSH